jgi:tRNA G46 methylase TrmB
MGDALLAMARARSNCDFLGCETHKAGLGAVLLRIEKDADVRNIRLYAGDAIKLLCRHIRPMALGDSLQDPNESDESNESDDGAGEADQDEDDNQKIQKTKTAESSDSTNMDLSGSNQPQLTMSVVVSPSLAFAPNTLPTSQPPENNCFDEVHIFFPDPWPEPRDIPRRLISPTLRQILQNGILRENGFVHLATDDTTYRDWAVSVFESAGWEKIDVPSPIRSWRPETLYEQRAIEAGRPIHDERWRWIGSPSKSN